MSRSPKDQVVLALDLDLEPVLGVEQHLVTCLYGPYVRAGGDYLGPCEAARDLRGGGYQDAGFGLAFTFRPGDLDENPVGEHLDRLLGRDRVVGGHCGQASARKA